MASPSAGFLSPFRDSDLTTFCRVHGTGTRKEKRVSFGSNGAKRIFGAFRRARPASRLAAERVLLGRTGLTGVRGGAAAAEGVRGGAVGVPGGPASPARDDSAPTSRATNPPPVAAADELAPKLDCPTSPGATTCTSDESEAAISFTHHLHRATARTEPAQGNSAKRSIYSHALVTTKIGARKSSRNSLQIPIPRKENMVAGSQSRERADWLRQDCR